MDQKRSARQNPGHLGVGIDQSRRERRIAQIVDAARLVFQDKGYVGFSMRGVAGRVGMTLANLQYYFPAKEELLRVSLSFHLREMIHQYATIANQPGLGVDRRFWSLVEQIFDDINETDRPQLLFEICAFAQRELYVAELVDEVYTNYCDIFARLLSEADPTLTYEECLARAFIIAAHIHGVMIASFVNEDSHAVQDGFIRIAKRSLCMLVPFPSASIDKSVCEVKSADNGPTSVDARVGVPCSGRPVKNDQIDLATFKEEEGAFLYGLTTQDLQRKIKVDEIVSLAANLLIVEGYANFTQARVAKELDTLVSSLQHYFPTFDDLFQAAVIKAMLIAHHDRFAQLGRLDDKPAIDRFAEIFEGRFDDLFEGRGRQFDLETLAVARRSELTHELLKNMCNTFRSNIANMIGAVDTSATTRECLARATLFTVLMDGTMFLLSGRKKLLMDVSRIRQLMSIVVIWIVQGDEGSGI